MCPAVEVFPRDLIFMEFDLPLTASLASALVILNEVPQVFSPRKTLSSGDTKFFRKELVDFVMNRAKMTNQQGLEWCLNQKKTV